MIRSLPLHGLRRAVAHVSLIGFVSSVLWVDFGLTEESVWPLIASCSSVAALALLIIVPGLYWNNLTHLPAAHGRTIAIIPVRNETDEHVRQLVLSVATQSIPPDEIHVMDDGSEMPLTWFECPTVTWHWQPHQGKRHAQANVLRQFEPEEWDFIFTVESDSIPAADALEHLLRSMSNPRVQAATGMIQSWFGAVTPPSGALALYRADLVYDNLEDYVSSGTADDDRRLSVYALLRGEVAAVHESVVKAHLPTTIKGMFFQRPGWSMSG